VKKEFVRLNIHRHPILSYQIIFLHSATCIKIYYLSLPISL
jgi:hypothetical protein